jgi:hypothetical protein
LVRLPTYQNWLVPHVDDTAFKPPPRDASPLYICTDACEPFQEGLKSVPAGSYYLLAMTL